MSEMELLVKGMNIFKVSEANTDIRWPTQFTEYKLYVIFTALGIIIF